ncbi:hypothetical protein [Litoreibacter roseus]|uniref:Stress response protein n=1 Tax=Litoreibacter roseus TaxID=2601869 RepID=A0A6N6JJ97_9RHOB|nr:hypothetical protein [Litoreibacter roseus]GFE66017.1 hypothetical protein KIN_30910 [Litoreibacter roseus]
MERPDYLSDGAPARLFPVLSTVSKEGRTTSIVLASMRIVDEFASALFETIGLRLGKRSSVHAFTEIVFKSEKNVKNDRPDGLIIINTGQRQWRALIETKIGKATLSLEQIERYRDLARLHKIDCVITISNQFATSPQFHPLSAELNRRNTIPVFHWSWMLVRTMVDYLLSNEKVVDRDQAILLKELSLFLSHESAGVEGFNKMPKEWSTLSKLVVADGKISKSSADTKVVVDAWHQETKDLCLILTRKLNAIVTERLPRKLANSSLEKMKATINQLSESNSLSMVLDIPDAASPFEVCADLKGRSISVGMRLRAPDDKKSSRARLNWLLRQVKTESLSDTYVRFNWPGRSDPTLAALSELREKPDLISEGREHLAVHSFEIFKLVKLGAKFGQQAAFIEALERIVPAFYESIGQNLTAYVKKPPKVSVEPNEAADISQEVGELD